VPAAVPAPRLPQPVPAAVPAAGGLWIPAAADMSTVCRGARHFYQLFYIKREEISIKI